MKKFYEINPDSFFYNYSKDKSVENLLSNEEKEERWQNAVNAMAIWHLESLFFSPEEQNFIIYSFINDLDSELLYDILMEYVNGNN